MSRVMDTPKHRNTRRDNISPPRVDTLNRRCGSDRDGPEDSIQGPRSTPDTIPATEDQNYTNLETFSDTLMAPQSEPRTGAPKSLPKTILATQELPERFQPDHLRKITKLSQEWVGLLKQKVAKAGLDGRVDIDGDQVHCQCNFSGKEGELMNMRAIDVSSRTLTPQGWPNYKILRVHVVVFGYYTDKSLRQARAN
ncbi:MAG: hypothetical protein Q9224_001332 [Gallowayella concinna]